MRSAPDYLINVSANENQVIIGALSFFILGVVLAGIAIVFSGSLVISVRLDDLRSFPSSISRE